MPSHFPSSKAMIMENSGLQTKLLALQKESCTQKTLNLSTEADSSHDTLKKFLIFIFVFFTRCKKNEKYVIGDRFLPEDFVDLRK